VELRRYLEVSLRWWWVVALAFVATTAVTVASVAAQSATYESSATFVVRPRPVDPSLDARAFDALIRGVTINTTYASVARSQLIRDRAEEQLDPAARRDDMSVSAKVLTDTNIVSLSVEGPDPDNVVDLATAISVETIEYVNGLTDVYVLEPLDEPSRPDSPVATNKMLTILVGLVLGVVLGIGMAMLVEYLRKAPAEPAASGASSAAPGAATSPTGTTARTKPQAPRKKGPKTAATTPAKTFAKATAKAATRTPAKPRAKTPAKTPAETPAETPAGGDGEAGHRPSRATGPPPTEPAASGTSTARSEDATSPKDTTAGIEPQAPRNTPSVTPANRDGEAEREPICVVRPAASAARWNGEPDRPG
jgi:capsular polysaccharide biosynthesis protein